MKTAVFLCVLASACFATPMTSIKYEATDLGSGRWQYTYEVSNIGLSSPIRQFSILFDYGPYSGLTIETELPLANSWDELAIQPEPVIEDNGIYDVLAVLPNAGIVAGQTVTGFAVSFNWLGQGTPGRLTYQIINPDTFQTIESGLTIPEPTTLLLLGLGGVILRRKK